MRLLKIKILTIIIKEFHLLRKLDELQRSCFENTDTKLIKHLILTSIQNPFFTCSKNNTSLLVKLVKYYFFFYTNKKFIF